MESFAELHLHIEGTLEPEFLLSLAQKNGIDLPITDLAQLKDRYNFSDLQDFLNLYYECMHCLKTSEDYTALANAYLSRVSNTGLQRVEAFFDPQTHAQNGNDFAKVYSGLETAFANAQDNYGIDAKLIMCFERDRGVDEAKRTLDTALEYIDANPSEVLIGVGLDSAEAPFPPAPFASVYQQARDAGLHTVAHAGEEGPPEFIWSALDDLGVERIDHGTTSLEDPALLKRLATDQIPVTVCPLSSVELRVSKDIKAVVAKVEKMLEAGVLATINSDDPAYFHGYIDDNFKALANAGLPTDAITQLKQNSLKATF